MEDVLIVEEEFFLSNVIAKNIEKIGLIPHACKTISEARQMIEKLSPSVILVDTYVSDGKGIDLVKETKEKFPLIQVIMITGSAAIPQAHKAIKHGAFDYIEKQNDLDKIPFVVNNAIERIRLIEQLNNSSKIMFTESHSYDIVGESENISKVRETISKILINDSYVFIHGSEGTGKKFISKTIHNYSERSLKPFVEVDSRTLTEENFEAEILGNGSTSRSNKCALKIANKGTLYFKNIELLSLNNQQKLLEIIQNNEMPVKNGTKSIEYDIRFSLSVSDSPEKLIEEGKLNQGLFDFFEGQTIALHQLTERSADIALLAEHFLKKYNASINKNIKGFTNSAMKLLKEHKWERSVQELAEIIEQAVLFENSAEIQGENINLEKEFTINKQDEFNINKKLKEYKDLLVRNALMVTNGNKTKTAKLLGVSRRQLYRYLD